MTVLLVAPNTARIPKHALDLLSDHFKRRWTGTFLLGLMPTAPKGLLSNEQFDWMSWPLGPGENFSDDLRLMEKLLKRFEVQAVLGLGMESAEILRKLGQGIILCFDRDKNANRQRRAHSIPVLDFFPGSELQALDSLDGWLVDRLAVDVLVAARDDWSKILAGLENHAAANRARLLRVRWTAKPSDRTIEFVDMLRHHEMFSNVAMELELLSSDLFHIRRSSLTHTPLDFLTNPTAWRQFASFVFLMLGLHPSVVLRVRTVSSKRWIRSSVELANSASGVINKALKLWRHWW